MPASHSQSCRDRRFGSGLKGARSVRRECRTLKIVSACASQDSHVQQVSLPYSMQAPALLQSHGDGVGITSDGGQLVVSCGDLPDPWISTDYKHAVISLR